MRRNKFRPLVDGLESRIVLDGTLAPPPVDTPPSPFPPGHPSPPVLPDPVIPVGPSGPC
jgi:hypothetical protein